MDEPSDIQPAIAAPSSQTGQITVEVVPRKLQLFYVTSEELRTLRGVGPTLTLAFFSLCIGAFTSFVGTLQTQTLDDRAHATFYALAVASIVLAAGSGIGAGIGYFRLSRLDSDIRSRLSAELSSTKK